MKPALNGFLKGLAILAIALVITMVVGFFVPIGPTAQASQHVSGVQSMKPIGTLTISNPSSSTAVNIPPGTTSMLVSIRTAGIHFHDYNSSAATTADPYLGTGEKWFEYDAEYFAANPWRIINSSDGSATVYFEFYGAR